VEEGKQEDWSGEREIRCRAQRGGGERTAAAVQGEQEYCGESDGAVDGPGGVAVDERERGAGEDEKEVEGFEVTKGEGGDGVGAGVVVVVFVLPCVDAEAVEAAERGEEKRGGKKGGTEIGAAGDGGDEGGGGEADANGDLFRQAVRAVGCVDEDEVGEDRRAEDEVEMNRRGFEMREERGECDGGEKDSGEEEGAVAMVEVVAGFEVGEEVGLRVEDAGVHETVGCVEHPDGEGHGERRGEGEMDLVGCGDEPGPQGSDGGGVEREEMPARERIARGCDCFGVQPGWGCCGHWIPV